MSALFYLQDEDNLLLDQVKAFVMGMTKEELRLAKKYLTFYQKDSSETQISKLYLAILNNPSISIEGLKLELKESNKGVERLLERLSEKLGYVVVCEFNMGKNSSLPLRTKIDYEIRVKTLLADICLTRGLQKYAIRLIERMREKALLIEDFAEVANILNTKIRYLHCRNGDKDFVAISNEIKKYEEYNSMLLKSKAVFASVSSRGTSYALIEDYTDIKTAYQQLSKFYTITQSYHIAHLLHQVKFLYYSSIGDFNQCLEAAFDLLKLDKNNEMLNKKQNIGIANLYIGTAYLGLKDFVQANGHLSVAKQNFYVNSFNYCLSEEIEFYVYFYSGDFELAEKKILGILKNPNYTKSNYMQNKKEYLYAYCLFAQNKVSQSIEALNKVHEIPKDKVGWNIGIRYLHAMLAIEIQDYDMLTKIMQAYERDLTRIKKIKPLRPREILIHRLFQTYCKEFSFTKALSKRSEDLSLMRSQDENYCWKIHTHELIPIHKWFEDKKEAEQRLAKVK